VNRADWQQIAEDKLLAAGALLAAHQWPSAYYLAGYALECGLKSCILARLGVTPEVIFDQGNKKYSENCWSHDIGKLLELADLQNARDSDSKVNPILGKNWLIVKDWSEQTRYKMKMPLEAQELYDAITDPHNGVMQWIRAHW
jgi:hypothetical protein